MSQLGYKVGSTHVYTMRELNQRTADVIREINESGEPAAITRRGRFVALVTPLADQAVEATAVAAALQSTPRTSLAADGDSHQLETLYTVDEAADALNVVLPNRPADEP